MKLRILPRLFLIAFTAWYVLMMDELITEGVLRKKIGEGYVYLDGHVAELKFKLNKHLAVKQAEGYLKST